MGAYLEARIAALHSGLQLTPEQERLWPPFEQAVRELAKLRQVGAPEGAPEGARQRGAEPPTADDLTARIERRADALTRRGAALKTLAQAAAPLWQSLDDGQKRRFTVLARISNFRGGFGGRDERGGFGRGFGPGGPGPGRGGERYGFGGPRGFGPRGFGRDGDGYRYGYGPREFDRRDLGRDGDFYRYGYGPAPREFGPRGFEPRDFGRDGGFYRYDYGPRDYGRGRGRPGGGFRTLDEPEGELGPGEASGTDERI